MLKHAAKNGATVIDETRVTELHFDGKRPVSASWVSRDGVEGQISFEYLVDATGRNGIMSTKYLKNRHYNKSLNNIACWGYWENTVRYMTEMLAALRLDCVFHHSTNLTDRCGVE